MPFFDILVNVLLRIGVLYFMKKKLIASLMLSTMVLANGASIASAQDNTNYDEKITAQDSKIKAIDEKATSAASQVTSITEEVTEIEAQQESLKEENEKLTKESEQLAKDIESLSKKIVARDKSLKKQARSAQTSGTVTSYINTIVNSKSITDAISRVNAMNEIVTANNKMLQQQKEDKEELATKQEENQTAIATVLENQQTLATSAESLKTKKAELEVAQLTLAEEKATAESEKSELQTKKAAAEKAAAEAAAAEKAFKEKQEAAAKAIVESGQTSLESQVQVASQTPAAQEQAAPAATPTTAPAATATDAPSAATVTPAVTTYSSAGNTYPVGQCTWGAKVLAPWAGNYWGNGGQWAASAAAAGFRTGSTPVVGAIACWNDGGYGHVAVVTAVESNNRIQVSEANYNGIQSIGNYRGWFDPTATYQGAAVYIYPN